MGDLAADTKVEGADGRYSAVLSEDWRIWGPNGGYVSSVALRAAGVATSVVAARPASIAVHFLGVARFEPVDIDVTPIRTTKRAESLRVSMSQHGSPIVEALVWTVADGLEGLDHDHKPMPSVPAPEAVPTWEDRIAASEAQPPPVAFRFWENIEHAGIHWHDEWPPPGPLVPETCWWARFRPVSIFADPWVDACRSLILLDTFGWPVASMAHAYREPHGFIAPTIDLSVRFHRADRDEPWLLIEGRSPVGAHGMMSAELAVWSRCGALLATGVQTMLCRPGNTYTGKASGSS